MENLTEHNGYPVYYGDFSCKADKCRNSCCVGWVINVDSDTLSLYENLEGEYSDIIRKSIKTKKGKSFFDYGKGERCPHLNENGLCNIITEYSETALCEICRLHPRFRHFFTGYVETGLGLSCEEVARIIVNTEEPFHIITDSNYDESLSDAERKILGMREDVFAILASRERKLSERLKYLCKIFEINIEKLNPKKFMNKLLRIEILTDEWKKTLKAAKKNEFSFELLDSEKLEIAYEQLSAYFIFRHFPACFEDGDIQSKVKFSVFAVLLLAFLMNGNEDKEMLSEYARVFSTEIEYSEENTCKLYKKL